MSTITCALQGNDKFPCGARPIEAVSLGIAAGGIALIFTFWLVKKVRTVYLLSDWGMGEQHVVARTDLDWCSFGITTVAETTKFTSAYQNLTSACLNLT